MDSNVWLLLKIYVILSLSGIALIILLDCLFWRNYYKTVNDKFYVRQGLFGKWEDLIEHIKKEHPELKI